MKNSLKSFTRYEIIKPLASGGMGTVVKAKLKGVEGFEKVVAIKTLLPRYQVLVIILPIHGWMVIDRVLVLQQRLNAFRCFASLLIGIQCQVHVPDLRMIRKILKHSSRGDPAERDTVSRVLILGVVTECSVRVKYF